MCQKYVKNLFNTQRILESLEFKVLNSKKYYRQNIYIQDKAVFAVFRQNVNTVPLSCLFGGNRE